MSKYFSFFPTTQHDLTNIGQTVQLTNILRRFTIDSAVKDNVGVFHEYTIRAGDRPDTIAYKYYGDSGFGWVVMMMNEIHDPIFGWPMFGDDFNQYIKGKYGSVPAAMSETHEYRKTITNRQTLTNGTIIPHRYVVVDNSVMSSSAYSGSTEYEKGDTVVYTSYDEEAGANKTKAYIYVNSTAATGVAPPKESHWQVAGNPITKFEWEVEQNEAKRNIKILDKRFLNTIKNELRTILRNGV